LLPAPAAARQVPDFASYIPRVRDAVSAGTRRVYGSYWDKVTGAWDSRPSTPVSALEVSQLAEQVRASAIERRNGRGRGAAEHLIGALRCMYRFAVADGILGEADNPAAVVPKPRRLLSARRALPGEGLAKIARIAASTGNDPALDALLIRLYAETACRRGGALALTPPGDLDREQCLILLREKGGTMRWQPVSPTLMTHLIAHAESRGGLDSGKRLLRYATGQPITARRYDYLWQRLGEHLPWVATQQVSAHWIRHTVLTWGRAELRLRRRPGLRRA
jgi:integrase/recombinase XerC